MILPWLRSVLSKGGAGFARSEGLQRFGTARTKDTSKKGSFKRPLEIRAGVPSSMSGREKDDVNRSRR